MAEYKAEYCDRVKKHGKIGKSWISFSAELDVTMREMLKWTESNPEFNDALEISQAHNLGYWEDKAADAIDDGNAQALQMAKFMLDQAFSIYEKIYKKKVQSVTPSDLNRKAVGNYTETNRNRDVLSEMINEQS